MSEKSKVSRGNSRFNLRYLTKEGFRNIHVHRLMTVASITVMLSCLLLIGGAYLIYVNIQSVIDRVGEQNVIMVFINDGTDATGEETLEKQIKAVDNVSECTFVSRDDSYSSILYDMGDSSSAMEGIDSSFLPDAYKVTINDMASFATTVASISALDNVLQVRENGELATKLASLQSAVSIIGLAIVVILLIVSLFIIANTVRITMFARKLEISIMKAVGATNWFIRWPFVVEGIVIGLLSALCSYGLVFLLYWGAEKVFSDMFSILGNTMVPWEKGMWVLLITFIITGVVTGAFGSLISLSRYLKEHGKVVE